MLPCSVVFSVAVVNAGPSNMAPVFFDSARHSDALVAKCYQKNKVYYVPSSTDSGLRYCGSVIPYRPSRHRNRSVQSRGNIAPKVTWDLTATSNFDEDLKSLRCVPSIELENNRNIFADFGNYYGSIS
jgi:hypothetical protein